MDDARLDVYYNGLVDDIESVVSFLYKRVIRDGVMTIGMTLLTQTLGFTLLESVRTSGEIVSSHRLGASICNCGTCHGR
jgi:hypothetical protein